MKIVKVMFFTQLKIFLGSLVIVPGIIWSYSYRMVPYLIAENPDLTPSEAMEMSDRLTYGHKIDIFILDLSFIGWILLGLLCCCIGTLFLAPYIAATDAQLYFALRSLQGGIPYSTAGNGGGYNSAPYNGPGPDVGPQQADNPYGTNTPPPAPPENNPYDVPTPPPTMDPFESMAPPPPPIDPFASVSPPPEYRDYKPDMPPAEPEQEQDGNGDGQGPDA